MLITGDRVGGADGIFDNGSACGNDDDDSDVSPLALPALSSFISSTRLNTIFDLEVLFLLLTVSRVGGAEGMFDDGSVWGDDDGDVGAGPLTLPAFSTFISSTILNTIFDLEGPLCLRTGGRVGGAVGIFDDGSVCDDGECDAHPFASPAFSTPTLSSIIPATIS